MAGNKENVPDDGKGGTGGDESRPSLRLLHDHGEATHIVATKSKA